MDERGDQSGNALIQGGSLLSSVVVLLVLGRTHFWFVSDSLQLLDTFLPVLASLFTF
jgi:hypothetical protein